jgi:ATP-binding cassette subfamily B protein
MKAASPRSIVPVRQTSTLNCGAACLVMILQYYDKPVVLEHITEQLSPRPNRGSSAYELVQLAARYGLVGRGRRVDADDITTLPPPVILHWAPRHFVIYEGCPGDTVSIVDPASGRRHLDMAAFAASYLGVALLFALAGEVTP